MISLFDRGENTVGKGENYKSGLRGTALQTPRRKKKFFLGGGREMLVSIIFSPFPIVVFCHLVKS